MSFSKVVVEVSESYLINFLSLMLVGFSIFFISWVSVNLINVPTLFLFLDFYVPLIYLLVLVMSSYLLLKYVIKELTYKFFVDYYVKSFVEIGKNYKYVDQGLIIFGSNFFYFFISFRKILSQYLVRFSYNSVVVLIFLVFILLWGFSLC